MTDAIDIGERIPAVELRTVEGEPWKSTTATGKITLLILLRHLG